MSKINRFNLLKVLYKRIIIPRGVFSEVVERGWGLSGSNETQNAVTEGWIEVIDVRNREETRKLAVENKISLENAETIQLSKELRACGVLADEIEVRNLAGESGFKVSGCLGLLLEAVRKRVMSVEEAKLGVERLIETGYRVDEEVIKEFHDLLFEIHED